MTLKMAPNATEQDRYNYNKGDLKVEQTEHFWTFAEQ